MLKIAVLVSGGGSNLQSILDYENKKIMNINKKIKEFKKQQLTAF